MKDLIINKIVDTVVGVTVSDSNGKVLGRRTFKNTLTKEGASVLSKLLVEPGAARPSHIYGRFSPAGNPSVCSDSTSFSSPTTYTDVNYQDFYSNNGGTIGTLREPLFNACKVENNGSIDDGKITFFFRLTPDSELVGTFEAGTSEIYFLGLAAARDSQDTSRDLIFSVLVAHDNTNGISVPAGGQVAIDYTLNLGV